MPDLFDKHCTAEHEADLALKKRATKEPTRYERFRDFHRANPQVFKLFREFAISAYERGHRSRFGARMLGERIRWYTSVETSDQQYKINDHYWPYYARLLALSDLRFAEFFENRGGGSDVDDLTLIRECFNNKEV